MRKLVYVFFAFLLAQVLHAQTVIQMVADQGVYKVPRDPITGKYWIDKAAGWGFEPAINEQNKRWK